ncbi:MAG: hypothetical protein ACOYNG_07730 [Terrimicrobiaceae bacterium]|jgi:hypothetical protein
MSARTERLKFPLILAALAIMVLKVGVLLLLNSRSRHIPESDE